MSKNIEKEEPQVDIECPFCKEKDFDLIGLKSHLLAGDCEILEKIPDISRIRW